jgi:hypothetical protein
MPNQGLSTQEVTGSSPVPPIFAPILSGEPGLKELLEVLLEIAGVTRVRERLSFILPFYYVF